MVGHEDLPDVLLLQVVVSGVSSIVTVGLLLVALLLLDSKGPTVRRHKWQLVLIFAFPIGLWLYWFMVSSVKAFGFLG